jgi:hypothetical protein
VNRVLKSSEALRRLHDIIVDRDRIDGIYAVAQVYERPARELRPIQRAIIESELFELGWCRLSNGTAWVR